MRRESSLSCAAAALIAVTVASPLGVTPSMASAADATVDLTRCLAPGAEAGDVRVFDTSQGSTLTETVLDTASRKSRSETAIVQAQLASFVPTVRETVTKPGRSVMLGDVAVGDLSIAVRRPKFWYPLAAVPGRTYHTEVNGKAYRDGARLGDALVSGDWQLVGFEPLTTPAGRSYPDTAHIIVERAITVGARSGAPGFTQESDVELWCVDGVGIVAASYAFRFFEDGRLAGEVSNLDTWLISATVAGEAVD